MNKRLRASANFRATVTLITLSIAITAMIKKYTK